MKTVVGEITNLTGDKFPLMKKKENDDSWL